MSKVDIEETLKLITHGVYVIAVKNGELENAFTAAWAMQVSFNPVLICFSINPEHYSYHLLEAGKVCTINVLSKQQMDIAQHFGTPGLKDKMDCYEWRAATTGAPALTDAVGFLDCKLSHFCDAGDHKLAVCEVVDAAINRKAEVMLYSDTGDMDGSSELYDSE